MENLLLEIEAIISQFDGAYGNLKRNPHPNNLSRDQRIREGKRCTITLRVVASLSRESEKDKVQAADAKDMPGNRVPGVLHDGDDQGGDRASPRLFLTTLIFYVS
eukprot:scaffold3430_cov162-Amphora_coffeaeformis.AAC.2